MKKLYFIILILNTFNPVENSKANEIFCFNDSSNSDLREDVLKYIYSDSSLNSDLKVFNIGEICLSNSLVYLDNRFFLKELVDYNFSAIDSNVKYDFYKFTTSLMLGCESVEFEKNKSNDLNDSCKAILFVTELHSNFIRADVEIIPKYEKEWDYSAIAYNSETTFSYLFFIKNNKIEKVFLKIVVR